MIAALLKAWSLHPPDTLAVICSVIQWKGSVPRKDYPMMIVVEDGPLLGTIGGGSMELKVTHSAREMIGKSSHAVFDFDMTGSSVEGDQGLCGGTLKVLIEPFSQALQDLYRDIDLAQAKNPKLMLQVTIPSTHDTPINRQLITKRGDISHSDPNIFGKVQQAYDSQRSTVVLSTKQDHILLWQPFTPPTIHIFGAGHVGQSVAELAHFNDIPVAVYDDRLNLITVKRFPYAKRTVTNFPILWEFLPTIPAQDFVLIASREHKHDRELLAGLLKIKRAYVGLVSSARKWSILSGALEQDGFSKTQLEQVRAPVGLNIDAQTVPEIAVSILAEIIATYRKSS